MKSNIKRVQESLAAKGVPALLISEINNVQWVSGFTGSWGFVIATPSNARFITDTRYAVQAKEEVGGIEIAVYGSPVEGADFIAQNAHEMGLASVGFEAQSVSYATYEEWKRRMTGVELQPVSDLIEPLRMVKTDDEVDRIRKACQLADACFQHVLRLIQPGVSELDIALEIEFFFRRQGAELAFPPIVVSGDRSARPHGKPSDKKLERGDFVTMDFGAKLNSYNSDITRTVVVQEVSDRHREVYDSVLRAQMGALEAMKPGVTAGEVDRLSRKILSENELDQYFGHGLGHGLGKVVHDGGRMNSSSKTVLEPGQVWTVEPGVYIEGFGGVRIEDDVVITEGGIEILTHSPKELLVLPA
jgi:Xaa-Pro aminopeptidase